MGAVAAAAVHSATVGPLAGPVGDVVVDSVDTSKVVPGDGIVSLAAKRTVMDMRLVEEELS